MAQQDERKPPDETDDAAAREVPVESSEEEHSVENLARAHEGEPRVGQDEISYRRSEPIVEADIEETEEGRNE